MDYTKSIEVLKNALEKQERGYFIRLTDISNRTRAYDLLSGIDGVSCEYDQVYDALEALEEAYANDSDIDDLLSEWADGQVSVYNADRIAWLAADFNRAFICDEAAQEFGTKADASLLDRIALGQYKEAMDIMNETRQVVETLAKELAEE